MTSSKLLQPPVGDQIRVLIEVDSVSDARLLPSHYLDDVWQNLFTVYNTASAINTVVSNRVGDLPEA